MHNVGHIRSSDLFPGTKLTFRFLSTVLYWHRDYMCVYIYVYECVLVQVLRIALPRPLLRDSGSWQVGRASTRRQCERRARRAVPSCMWSMRLSHESGASFACIQRRDAVAHTVRTADCRRYETRAPLRNFVTLWSTTDRRPVPRLSTCGTYTCHTGTHIRVTNHHHVKRARCPPKSVLH